MPSHDVHDSALKLIVSLKISKTRTNFGIDGKLEREQFNDDADISWDDVTAYFPVDAARTVSLVHDQRSDVSPFCVIVSRTDRVCARHVYL